jgi:ABC-2 type transport system permease protein
MRAVLLIAQRDLAASFKGWLGYLIVAALLCAEGIAFQAIALGDRAALSSEVLVFFFWITFGFTCAAGIFLSMGSLSSELRDGTIVTLYTAPISEWQIVLGKWLASLAFVLLFVALTFYMPLLVAVNGSVNGGHVLSGYLGLGMTAAVVTAIGVFASSMTRHWLVAGVVAALLVGMLIVFWWVAAKVDPPFGDVLGYLSLYSKHFDDLAHGIIHTRDFVYYATLTFAALVGARVVLGARRWR